MKKQDIEAMLGRTLSDEDVEAIPKMDSDKVSLEEILKNAGDDGVFFSRMGPGDTMAVHEPLASSFMVLPDAEGFPEHLRGVPSIGFLMFDEDDPGTAHAIRFVVPWNSLLHLLENAFLAVVREGMEDEDE